MRPSTHPALLTNEAGHEFRSMRENYLLRFQPADSVERDLTLQLATTAWRLQRLYTIEAGAYNNALRNCALSLGDDFRNLPAPMQRGLAHHFLAQQTSVLSELRQTESHLRQTYDQTLQSLLALQRPHPPVKQRRPYLVPKAA